MSYPTTTKGTGMIPTLPTFGNRGSFRLLRMEMVITKTLMSVAIMVPFWNSIGMDQGQIGFSQLVFTGVLLVLNMLTGLLADKASRKWCNFGGDAIIAGSLALYATVDSLAGVIVCEAIFGFGAALSHGADSGLFKAFCGLIARDPAHKNRLIHHFNGQINIWRPVLQIVLVIIGGFIGASSPRLAILLSAVPFACGAIAMLFVREVGERLTSTHRNPLREIWGVIQHTARDVQLRWAIIAFAVGREITHVMIWALTPILVLVGVPVQIVAFGWAINLCMVTVGAITAKRWAMRLPEWLQFALPISAVLVALSIMSVHLSIWTVGLYSVLGFSQGWTGTALQSMVQIHARDDRMSSVDSASSSLAMLLYMPLVWLIGSVGSSDIRWSIIATIAVFTPLTIFTSIKLRSVM